MRGQHDWPLTTGFVHMGSGSFGFDLELLCGTYHRWIVREPGTPENTSNLEAQSGINTIPHTVETNALVQEKAEVIYKKDYRERPTVVRYLTTFMPNNVFENRVFPKIRVSTSKVCNKHDSRYRGKNWFSYSTRLKRSIKRITGANIPYQHSDTHRISEKHS